MLKRAIFSLATLTVVTLAGATQAKPALRDVPEIRDGIIAVGIAYEISEQCDEIRARKLRGLNFLFGLKSTARNLGYSDSEIDAFVDNRAEQDRLEAMARAQLAQKGAVPGDAATYCAVGRAEMAKGSAIGNLLR